MASAYLQRATEAGSNGRTWTYSVWAKLTGVRNSATGAHNQLWNCSSDNDSSHYIEICIKNTSALDMQFRKGTTGDNGTFIRRITTREFKDPNAWYHIVLRMDTTQASASDRFRVYINGTQETAFSTSTGTIPQNYQTELSTTGSENRFGRGAGSSSSYWDGQMAHLHLCDGYSYAPTEFGETDSTTGNWKPKTAPSVSYGTNGCFLKFDNSANMGLDSSGESHNFTTSGTIIQVPDTPSNIFCSNNMLWHQENTRYLTYTNLNNLISGGGSSTWYQTPGTLAFSKGKYYWECKFNAGTNLDKNTAGVIDIEKTVESGQFQDKAGSVFYKNEDGGETRIDGTTSTADYGTLAQNDILGVAVDMDAATPTVKFYKNGSLLVTASASSLAGKTVTPAQTIYTSGEYQTNYGNGYFGTTAVASAQNPSDGIGVFEHSVPSGYKALCTKSINAQEYS